MLGILLVLTAGAATPEQVLARVDETAPLRARRLEKGAPAIPRDAYERAVEGKIVSGSEGVEGHKARKVWGVGVFPVPIGRYWAALNDDPSKAEWTKLDYAEVVKGKACAAPRRVFQFASVPLLTDRWWLVDIRYNDALKAEAGGRVREQTWATDGDFTVPTPTAQAWADKGMHITSTHGSWFLVDLDGKSTLVEYYTWADPGGMISPRLASSLAVSGVSNTLTKMAELAAHGPTCAVE